MVARVEALQERFVVAVASIGVALTTSEALSGTGGSVGFAASYVVVRLILIGLYLRAYHHEPQARPLCLRYVAGFGAGAAFWLSSVFVPAPARYVLWAVGMLIELATPLLSAAAVRSVPFHAYHIAERLGLLTIIVLGETVVLVAYGLGVTQAGVAAIGFLVAAALWWSYFTFVDGAALGSGSTGWQSYLYGHLAIVAGIAATGVGVLLATNSATEATLVTGARWALCGGPACFLLATGLIRLIDRGTLAAGWFRITAGLVVVALAGLGSGLPPGVFVTLVLLAPVVHIIVETITTPEPNPKEGV